MVNWSSSWKSSTHPRKQRKYVYEAPNHVRAKLMGAHLSKDLRTKYGTRSLAVRKGDRVKIMRGQFRGKSGKVEQVIRSALKVYVTGVELIKKDGTKVFYPIAASNLMITELAEDKRRLPVSATAAKKAAPKFAAPKVVAAPKQAKSVAQVRPVADKVN